MEKLLVVGGGGFIGRHLVEEAIKKSYEVSVLSLGVLPESSAFSMVNHIRADVSNPKELHGCLGGRKFDYVVNLSGYVDHSSFTNGGRCVFETHFNGVLNLLLGLDNSGVRRFIQIGSSDEYGDVQAPQTEDLREAPISPYSLGKVASTHMLQMLNKTEGFPVVILRPFIVFGPGQGGDRFVPQVIRGCLSGVEFPVSLGNQVRDFCYVGDVVNGILKAMIADDVNGHVINIASGKPVTVRKVIDNIRMIIGGGSPAFGEIPFRPGENMELYADISKAKELLDWEPVVSLNEGLERTIKYYS